jgi:hypothetical protein
LGLLLLFSGELTVLQDVKVNMKTVVSEVKVFLMTKRPKVQGSEKYRVKCSAGKCSEVKCSEVQ